jgi:hypothetical protein
MKKIMFFVGIIAFISSCSPKISTTITKQHPPLTSQEKVLIFGLQDPQPRDAEILGIVRIGNAMTSKDCDLYTILPKAMTEARKIGGNALKITEHIPNSNACHQITASILKLDYPEEHTIETIPHNANYALLHLFRPNGLGTLLTYDLFLDTSIIARSGNNWRETVKFETEGEYVLWGRTEQTASLPLNIKHGNEYYVRSSIGQGIFVGRPALTLMDNNFGRIEFQSITTKTNYSMAGDTLNKLEKSTFPRFRFAISGGWGYRTASLHKDLDVYQRNYVQKLKSGFQFDLSASYFFFEQFGVGLKYSDFFTNYEEDNWSLNLPGGSTPYGVLKTETRTTFVGPTFAWRIFDKQKRNCFVFDVGFGYMGYREKRSVNSEGLRLDATTVGTYLGVGYDLWLSAATSLGFQFAAIGGSYSRYTVTSGGIKTSHSLETGNFEGIGRIELSVGLRF